MSRVGRSHTATAPALLAFGVLALVQGCAGNDAEDQPGLQLPEERSGPRLELSAEPINGDAPLAVRFRAQLLGDITDPAGFDCPTLAWTLDDRDDGQVVLAQASDCLPGEPVRSFVLEHSYTVARSYEASVRLIALDLPPSNVVQILVRGATATPAPQVAVPGPTIIIATPASPPSPFPTRVALAEVAEPAAGSNTGVATAAAELPGEVAAGEAEESRAATAVSSIADRPGRAIRAVRVLPADLYFVASDTGALWRLPAAGLDAERVSPSNRQVQAYAVSVDGRIAYAIEDELRLIDGSATRVLTQTQATALAWSRDGRRLAYAAEGLVIHDLDSDSVQVVDEVAAPLAWSREGDSLVAQDAADRLALVRFESGAPEVVELPISGVASAGWLPGRETVWLAGAGLRLLGLDRTFRLVEILPPDITTTAAFVRADDRLLSLVGDRDARQPFIVDLRARDILAEPLGPALGATPETDLTWAPGGRFAALAGPEGLSLLDPASGVQVSLLRRPVSDPSWNLSLR